MRELWKGLAAGFVLGYAAMRVRDAGRDRMSPFALLERRDPASYGAAKRRLMLAGLARSTAALAMTAFVIADPLERSLRGLPRPLRAPAFVTILTLIDAVRDLPADYVEGFVLERIYGTSEQRAASWAGDRAKGAGVSLAVTLVLVALGDATVRRAPRTWPLLAIGAAPLLLALANVVAPTYVLPLFNTYTPLEGSLAARIRDLAARYGVGNAAILRFDMSRQTKKANAFVTGVFGTERIVLADTLIDAFAEDETLFVVAHELGHYVRRDPWVSIAAGTAFAAVTITGGNVALAVTGRRLESAADGARFAFYAGLIAMLGAPLMAALSRSIERRADRFAIEATGDPAGGARAFRRLRDQNLAEDEQPKWAELLFASHPSLRSRIARLEAHPG